MEERLQEGRIREPQEGLNNRSPQVLEIFWGGETHMGGDLNERSREERGWLEGHKSQIVTAHPPGAEDQERGARGAWQRSSASYIVPCHGTAPSQILNPFQSQPLWRIAVLCHQHHPLPLPEGGAGVVQGS